VNFAKTELNKIGNIYKKKIEDLTTKKIIEVHPLFIQFFK
jgi:hypothetical protein